MGPGLLDESASLSAGGPRSAKSLCHALSVSAASLGFAASNDIEFSKA